ncbi:MAG: RHS repeat-associated core domain-containing protein [Blastocatellia bacterium]
MSIGKQSLSIRKLAIGNESLNRLHLSILGLICLGAFLGPRGAFAQNVQYTQNIADTTLRSRFRVDPSTLGLSLQIPLGHYPGRGGAQLPITLYYGAKVWNVNFVETRTDVNDNPIYNILEPAYGQYSVSGWTCSLTPPTIEWTGYMNETYESGISNGCTPPPTTKTCEYISRMRVYMPDGSSHELRKDDLPRDARQPLNRTGTFLSVDGSRLRFETSSNTLYLLDGSRYLFNSAINHQAATQFIDRNGNTLDYSSAARQWTDSLGRVIGVPLPVDPALGGMNYSYEADRPTAGDYNYDVPGVGGSTLRYRFRWSRMSSVLTVPGKQLAYRADHTFANGNPKPAGPYLFVTSPGPLSPEPEPDASGNGVGNRLGSSDELFNPVVLSEIVLPNSVSYKFTYNTFGEIDKVVYPTGGYERYTHSRIAGTSYLKPIYAQANRGVVDQFVSAAGTSGEELHWQYSAAYSAVDAIYTVTATAPDSTRIERMIHVSRPSGTIKYGFDDVRAGMSYEERTYSASDEMLRRTLTDWRWDGPTAGGEASAMRDQRVSKQVEIVLDTGGDALTKKTTYQYDQDLNVISVTEFDFVSVAKATAETAGISTFASGSQMRKVETTYLVNDSAITSSVRAAYRARQLIALPTLAVTKNSANSRVAEVQMVYDEAAYPLLSYSSVPGWVDPGTTNRGNVTTTRRWLDTTNTYIETHVQYDKLGNPRNSWDALGRQSQLEYASVNAYAYPTLSKTPVPDTTGVNGLSSELISSNVFDSTGLLTSTIDSNGQTTSYVYSDPLNRLTSIVRPTGGGSTTISYSDTSGSFYVRTQTDLDASRVLDGYQYFDGLGRPSRALTSEGSGYIVTDTQYDSMLRVLRVSNPYRTALLTDPIPASVEWTTTLYDSLGRIATVGSPDGAVVATDYSGMQVTVTDQAGKARKSTSDALGRMISVVEDPAGLNYQTTYGYDALDDLTAVTQGTQPSRTFSYDSLRRLTQAFNPESGTVSYTYDANSNLSTKLDARNITTTYGYDALNRVISRSYLGESLLTPSVTYKYDGAGVTGGVDYSKGKLTLVSSSVSSYSYDEYDQMGRLKRGKQTTGGVGYSMSYAWDLAGNKTSEVYPSGRTVSTGYDDAGRLLQVSGAGIIYASGISYAPHGSMAAMTLGNSLIESTTFNSRLQPTVIKLGTATNLASVLQLGYEYNTTGQTDNNGNVLKQTITLPGSPNAVMIQSYTYDALNRLGTATETGAWTQTYDYDRWGNRAVRSGSHIPTPRQTPTSNSPSDLPALFNQVNNRIKATTEYGYDAAGNLTSMPGIVAGPSDTMTYDAENRQKTFNGTAGQYFYDGDGRRVKKIDGSGTTVFVYNAVGQLIAEYHSDAVPQPAGGGGTSYLTSDHLGSTRVVTDGRGNVKARHDYLPFGEELRANIGQRTTAMKYDGADSTKQKFTQKERDSESGLDYFLARYYSSAQGRFLSIDPQNAGTTKKDPQSWNGYMYGRNNPLKYVDPDGLKVRVYDENGNYHDLSDEEANNSIFNKKYIKSIGFTVKGGNILDDKGKLVGTYTRISFDDFTRQANAVVFGLAARAKAMNQAIAAFGIGTVAIGATGGAAAYAGGVVLAGSSLTTLEIGEAGVTVAEVEQAAAAGNVVAETITGYTKHGINSAISHDGVGVSARAILDAVKNPIKLTLQSGGRVRIDGKDATVILNQVGKIITTWARSSAGTRIP